MNKRILDVLAQINRSSAGWTGLNTAKNRRIVARRIAAALDDGLADKFNRWAHEAEINHGKAWDDCDRGETLGYYEGLIDAFGCAYHAATGRMR